MISENRFRKDGRKIEQVGEKYLQDGGAMITLIVDGEGKNVLTVGGDAKQLVDGVILALVKIALNTEAMNENVFAYVAKTAQDEYRHQKGLPAKRRRTKSTKAEVKVEEVPVEEGETTAETEE